jgi:hypothetical protein
MTGAEYVAMLGGAVRPRLILNPDHLYSDAAARWVEIAASPFATAIDGGVFTVCPECRFVEYSTFACRVCAVTRTLKPEDVESLLEEYWEDGQDSVDEFEETVNHLRIEWSLDLFDGPSETHLCGRAVFAARLLRMHYDSVQ